MHPQRNKNVCKNEKTKKKERKERITNNFIDYKKETIFSPIFFMTLFEFQTKAYLSIRFSNGELITRLIIAAILFQIPLNTSAGRLRKRRPSLIRVVRWLTNYHADRSWRGWNAAYWPLMHALFMRYCASAISLHRAINRFLSRRIWLVYSWNSIRFVPVQNERRNSRIGRDEIDRDFSFRMRFEKFILNGLRWKNARNECKIFSDVWTKVI